MKIKLWKITAALVVLIAVLSWLVIWLNAERKQAQALVSAHQGVITEYSIQIDTLKEKVYETKLIVVDHRRELELTKDQMKRLAQQHINNLQVIAALELRISALQDSLVLKQGVDTIEVEEVIFDVGGDTIPMVRVPLSFEWANDYARSWAEVSAEGLGTSGFEVRRLPIDLAIGSRGIFKKEQVVAISTPNPYVTLDKQQVQMVQKKKGRTAVLVTTSALCGGLIALLLTSL